MTLPRKLMSATKRNTLNLLTAAQADSPTTANGWTAGGTTTCVAGSTTGPFGFGTSALMTTGAAGARTLTLAAGTFGYGGAKFSVFVKLGTATGLVLGIQDATNALIHGCSFTYSSGTWTVGALLSGATAARVQPYYYDGVWTRLEVEFIPGASGGGATSRTNNMTAYIQLVGNSTTAELWGAMLENSTTYVNTTADGTTRTFSIPAGISKGTYSGTNADRAEERDLVVCDNEVYVDPTVTSTRFVINREAGTITFDTAPTNTHVITCSRRGDFSSPYLVGLESGLPQNQAYRANVSPSYGGGRRYQGNELPLFRPERLVDETGVFYTEWLNTPSGAMKLQGRSDPTAPWFDLVSITQASLNASGQYAATVTLMPEMRVILPTVGNTTVTFTAWILE